MLVIFTILSLLVADQPNDRDSDGDGGWYMAREIFPSEVSEVLAGMISAMGFARMPAALSRYLWGVIPCPKMREGSRRVLILDNTLRLWMPWMT